MGLSLAVLLAESGAGGRIVLIGRRRTPPRHPVLGHPGVAYAFGPPGSPPAGTRVFLAVPDGAIEAVADELASLGDAPGGCIALHLSGARPAGVLRSLSARGYAVGSLHPLQSVADPAIGAGRLSGSCFTFEGDEGARDAALEIVEAAGGRMLEVEARAKPRYHAACVFASNYIVACAAVAVRLLSEAAGITPEQARRALGPLWRGAVRNLDELGLPGALTGPIARGDASTVAGHLAALDEETGRLYRRLGLEAVSLGRQLGLSAEAADELEKLLNGAEGAAPDETLH